MAKKATKSQTSHSSSSSAAVSASSSTLKMQLRPRPSGVGKRLSAMDYDEERLQLAKKPKTVKKKNVKFDPNKPKKPPTAFFYFLEDFRKDFQEKNPDIKSMREVGKACGEKWKTMTYEEKVQYYDIATEKRAEFDRAMAEYIRRKESGEDQESEEFEYDE